GGLVALQDQRLDDARERWGRLVALGPPPEVAAVLEEQIASLGDGRAASVPADSLSVGEGEQTAADAASIRLEVQLAPGLPEPAPEAALFVFARSSAGGPPVAA